MEGKMLGAPFVLMHGISSMKLGAGEQQKLCRHVVHLAKQQLSCRLIFPCTQLQGADVTRQKPIASLTARETDPKGALAHWVAIGVEIGYAVDGIGVGRFRLEVQWQMGQKEPGKTTDALAQ